MATPSRRRRRSSPLSTGGWWTRARRARARRAGPSGRACPRGLASREPLVQRNPFARDDLRRLLRVLDPLDELLRATLGLTLGHHVEVPQAQIRARLGVLQGAGDALVRVGAGAAG